MRYPPSLSLDVIDRAFRAHNGELGLVRDDALAYLTACAADGIEVLGWELWLVDHVWGFGGAAADPCPGAWTGAIPRLGSDDTAIIGGTGDLETTRREITEFDLETTVSPAALPFIRFCIASRDCGSPKAPYPAEGRSLLRRVSEFVARCKTGPFRNHG